MRAGRLAEILDAERPAVCDAYDVRYRSVLDHIRILYGGDGDSVHQAVANSAFYRGVGELRADIWKTWMATDLPLAHVPFVLLAEAAGCTVPLHRGFVDIVAALLGITPWEDGLTLERLGLGPCYHMLEVLANPDHDPIWHAATRGEPVDWDALFTGYRSAVDWPAAASSGCPCCRRRRQRWR